MSSIIDALKKSDKNRTADSGQNTKQIKFGNEPPQKNRRVFWLLVAFLLLVTLAVLAWQQGWHHTVIDKTKTWFGSDESSQTEPVAKQNNPADDALNPTVAKNGGKNKNQGQSQGTTKQAVKNQGNKLTPPKANDVKAKTLAAEQTKTSAQTNTSSEKQEQLEVIAKRNPNNEQTASDHTQTINKQTDLSNKVQPSNTKNQTEPEPASKAEVVAAENRLKKQNERKDTEPELKQDYLLVHQIDFEIRKNIPPIKLNVHIYDPEPENRMVILNGVKYATGDSIEELVTVEKISQEGVVLEFEGTQFLIPK